MVLVFLVMPVGFAVFFGLFTIRHIKPLVYRCRRCANEFLRKSHRGFPRSCPRCRARDWNAG